MRDCQPFRLNKKAKFLWAAMIVSLALLGIVACGNSSQQDDGVSKASLRSTKIMVQARGDNANASIGTILFTDISIQSEAAQLELRVSDIWHTTPDNLRDKMVDEWMGAWMTLAGNNGWTGLARVQFIDSAEEQVAHESRLIPALDGDFPN